LSGLQNKTGKGKVSRILDISRTWMGEISFMLWVLLVKDPAATTIHSVRIRN
jgi:hypothetical protein